METIYRVIPAICIVLFFDQSPCICSIGGMFAPDLIVDHVCNDLTFLQSLANQSMNEVFEKYPTVKTDKDSCPNSRLDYTKYSICINKKWIHCNATSDDAETRLPALLFNSKPIELRCKFQHNLLREPYELRKDLPIKPGKINRQRFFGVAVPCNNDISNGSTIFTAFFGRYQEVPLVNLITQNHVVYNPTNEKTNQSSTLHTTTIRSKTTFSTIAKNLGSGYNPLFVGLLILVSFIFLGLLTFYIISKSRKKRATIDDCQELRKNSNMNNTNITDSSTVTNIGKYEALEVCLECMEMSTQCGCDNHKKHVSVSKHVSISSDNCGYRQRLFSIHLDGNPKTLNPNLSMNEQVKSIKYNPKLEIDRSNFIVGKILGSGNFGCVFEGEASGLIYPNSKTKVAVKTTNNPLDSSQQEALLSEIKILSNLDLHLNLVNMMGSCTTDIHLSGELWLLLEFCEHGDMKSFLIKYERDILHDNEKYCGQINMNSRLLIQLSYDIAKGMKYLSRKHIMHGDLAARNILIGGQECDGSLRLVAKVSDFGLSKTFYDNISYRKQKRNYVPWKWMAPEYLNTSRFTLASDVWSFGVVIWEIFSLGKEPYVGQSVENMITKLKTGYSLPCPEEVNQIESWSPKELYDKIASYCFVTEPIKRGSFSHLVQVIESILNNEEKLAYKELTDQYESMSELMSDKSTRFKRSISQFKRVKSEDTYSKITDTTNISSNETTSLLTISDIVPEEKAVPSKTCIYSIIENEKDLSENNDSNNIFENDNTNLQPSSDTISTLPTLTTEPCYILSNTIDVNDKSCTSQEEDSSAYKTFQEIMSDSNNEQKGQPYLHYLDMNSSIQNKTLNQENTDEGNSPSGYISIECANT